jgi:signal recognition particle GTPase
MEMLENTTVFTLQTYGTFLRDTAKYSGVTGWRSILPGASSDPNVQNYKVHLKIADELDKLKIAMHEDIQAQTKVKVAELAGTDVAEVNVFLRRFGMTSTMHKWVHDLKSKGIVVPKDSNAMQSAMRTNPIPWPKSFQKMMMRSHPAAGAFRRR